MSVIKSVETINSVVRTLIALVIVSCLGTASWVGYQTYRIGLDKDASLKQAQSDLVQANTDLTATRQQLDAASVQLDNQQQKLTSQRKEIETQGQQLATKDRQLSEKNTQIAAQDKQIETMGVEIDELGREIEQKNLRIEQLDLAMRLLKVDHRVARLTVIDKGTENGKPFLLVEFQEVDPAGRPLDEARQLKLKGSKVYVDSLVVKFEDRYIEEADLLRATSLYLFNSIYGDLDGPANAVVLEREGKRPNAYGSAPMTEFEKKIWGDFWEIANNQGRASELGIRAIHGQANYLEVRKGKVYVIEIRASGGLSFVPAEESDIELKNPA